MIRAVQMLGVSALICAGGVFLHCTDQWLHGAAGSEPEPGLPVTERFRQAGGGAGGNQETVSPLVEQATAFAQYLSPPELTIPRQDTRVASTTKKTPSLVKLAETTAKFTLVATSYYGARPEKSLALVSEPGRENRWVRPGERLGHFIIESIEQGSIVYRNGDRSGQMAVGTDISGRREEAPEVKLASGQTEGTEVKPSAPHKPRKSRTRRPMQRLGPVRPESPLLAHGQMSTNG
ncbi:MAG: hypothetical protein JSW59_12635 [Phycisphaerales bacterium]|nr:MAG: hypothetical protein JSW59_12635 [Phycisphaerales bacterium]